MQPTPIRHTQLFTYLLLLATREWASFWVKVDTAASRNVLPLHLFRQLYPNCIDKTGYPTGLNESNTRLTAYNGTQIPLFGLLHGPIIWQPGSPSAQPHHINSCWYVQTPLVLPSRGSHHVRDWKLSKWTVLSRSSKTLAWSHSSTSNTQENISIQVYRGPHQKVPR